MICNPTHWLNSDSKSTTLAFKGKIPAQSIVHFLREHPIDLVVIATHGRDGADHWLSGSVSEDVFGRFAIPTLFVTQGARGFVSQVSGDVRLRRVLIPIDYSPAPSTAIEAIQRFGAVLTGKNILMYLIHVGNSVPPVNATVPVLPTIILRSGDVVKSIVDAAIEYDVDLIGMPTAGRHGVLDALRGSMTERVIRHAPCPVLRGPLRIATGLKFLRYSFVVASHKNCGRLTSDRVIFGPRRAQSARSTLPR